jgi:lactoylglutathione lyase
MQRLLALLFRTLSMAGADDVYKTADAIKKAGGKVTKEPTELPGIGTKITATTDPDGWKVVFVDNKDFLKELE